MAELTPKTKGPEVPAGRRGTCAGPCIDADGKAIVPGEHYIAKVDGHGWMHALCAKAYCAAINEEVNQVAGERAADIRQICRRLHDLDVPGEAIEPVERFAGELEARAA